MTSVNGKTENASSVAATEQPSQLSLLHSDHRSNKSHNSSRRSSRQGRSDRAGPSSETWTQRYPDELEEADSDTASEFDAFMRQGRIQVGQTWDDSSDDEAQPIDLGNRTLPLSSKVHGGQRNKKKVKHAAPESLIQSMRPTREHRKAWWNFLTNPGTPASLSAPHVSVNLFSASLHPAVLLSMPNYFARTGILAGTIALIGVAALGGVGGGLWVVLSRYVNGSSIEAIVGSSFGRYTRWKGGLGRAVSGLLLGLYALGSAIIGYFALADLLLQVFFHYSPRGVPLHDRAFVTLVIGGLISIPLVIFPLAKRNVIRLNTFFSLTFYPIIALIVLVNIYSTPPATREPTGEPILIHIGSGLKGEWPNFNPLKPPSIWAPVSLLPLLTLSACPLQILAHQRSLRRIGTSRSNVAAFVGAQVGQVVLIVVLGLVFGVAAGTQGVQGRLGKDVHPNLFASLPTDDDSINFARVLFIAILATHLAICLMTARSSWGRLLRLLDINPLRRRKAAIQLPVDDMSTSTTVGASADHTGRMARWKRQWGKPARNALAGLLLWGITASSAYLSGAGGFRRKEKEGEEARFTRASEVLGLMGAGVGFVLPGLVWLVIFHVRRPRAILPLFASELGKSATAYFVGPQSLLARNRKYLFGPSSTEQEEAPLLSETASARPQSRRSLSTQDDQVPSHLTEQTSEDRDQATSILLARKERQLQRKTRGKRIYQDVIVIAAVLPFGFALLILGAVELRRGGF